MKPTNPKHYRVLLNKYENPPRLVYEDRLKLNPQATFARELLLHYGMIVTEQVTAHDPRTLEAISTNQELMDEIDVVERACNLATFAYERFESLGWVSELPSMDEHITFCPNCGRPIESNAKK